MSSPHKEIEIAAIRLLSFREHAPYELSQKLLQKEFPQELIDDVIQYCIDNDYLSCARYAEMMVRTKSNQGYGPFKISLLLKAQRVPEDIVTIAFASQEIDWFELACSAFCKHAKSDDLSDYKRRTKTYRYLQQKGFNSEQINYAYQQWLDTNK